jgi:hypothetical protein
MIKPEDVDFHTPPEPNFRWCETNPFLFNIPEHRISGVLYVVTRPVLGVCMSDITVQDRFSRTWEAQAYVDNQQHLPCPKSLVDYALPNGLQVRAVTPLKHYDVHYEGIDDTRIDLEFKALMDPFDMNDPEMDPMAARRLSHGWSSAFGGHFEITGRVTGELVLRGKSFKIDCIDTLDRSWGPRQERDNANVIWLHGSFGERLTVHALLAFDPARGGAFGALISGYVLEDGKVFGVTEASGHTERDGIYPISTVMTVTDARGKTFALTASAINCAPWAPYPSVLYTQALMRWNYDGKIGYGVQQEVISRAYLGRHRDALRLI